MSTELAWSDALLLGHGPMDRTHREFVEVVQAMMRCADVGLATGLRDFIAHAQAHFGDEDRSMGETAF
ncbi:MAG TPA: hemerythrin, partial [Burkholderiaceae bacterium]|nr:hemerythrin [Burkholderiaceae bacterium]